MYEFIGKLLVYSLEISVILVALALLAGYVALKKRVLFYGLFADILDFFYYPLLWIFVKLDKRKWLDKVMVNLKNQANKGAYIATKKRVIIAGQCSRHIDCPAPSTREGIKCLSCGRCVFAKLKKEAEARGYKLYILTGSSYLKYLIKKGGFDGILGVVCNYELNKGTRWVKSTGIPVYGVPLTKDGCYNTEFNLDKVVEAMDL